RHRVSLELRRELPTIRHTGSSLPLSQLTIRAQVTTSDHWSFESYVDLGKELARAEEEGERSSHQTRSGGDDSALRAH
ncbi:hypothetical protein, partial [Marisediminicola sp. UYEF4]|uniref:hypothetical protein n=1 Tax=Marisediminicola sp. UYEF4 TaxID=1756384 RepID=UPI00339AECA1